MGQQLAFDPLPMQRRRYPRMSIRCHARIRIGVRQYAAVLHDISRVGARIRTLSPLRDEGDVVLRLPDLPPIRGELRWSGPAEAGIIFHLPLSRGTLESWIRGRPSRPTIGAVWRHLSERHE